MSRRLTPATRRALDRALDRAHLERAGRAATDESLDRPDALVHGGLYQFAFSRRVCWPAQQTLADLTGLRREDVNRACARLRERGLISWTKAWSPRSRHLHNVYELHGRWHPPHRRPLLRWLDRRRGDHTKRTATVEKVNKNAAEYLYVEGSQRWQHQRCGRERVRERESCAAGPTEVQTQGAGAKAVVVFCWDGNSRASRPASTIRPCAP
jgi:hypothetical protein